LRMRYGSDEALEFIDKIYQIITTEMYKESSSLATEKGPFPKFELDKFLESGFIKQMPDDVVDMIKDNGMRNVTLTTQAPTGTVGSMLGTSTGIEPYYAFKFYRQSRLGFHEVFIPLADEYKHNGDLPEFFTSAMELTPLEHIKVQAAVQKWTDSSISKTANAPADFTVEQTDQLYIQAYEMGCKGVTIYRDSSRDEQVLSTNKDTEDKNLEYNHNGNGNGKDKKEVEEKPVEDKPAEEEAKIIEIKEEIKQEIPEMQNPLKHKEVDTKYGSDAGMICPQCKEGVMIKLGGCTECSKQCGFKGACDMK